MLTFRTLRPCRTVLLSLACTGLLMATLMLAPTTASATHKDARSCPDLAALELPETRSITAELVVDG
jgi:hypothetical protein